MAAAYDHLRLLVTGMVMSATLYPTCYEDDHDFLLWATSWELVKPLFLQTADELGWADTGYKFGCA